MAASDITMLDGTYLADIIANLNSFASLPTTSRGAGEIIHYSGDNTIRWNSQTTNPTTNPTWSDLSAGGGVTDHGALTGLTDDDHTQYLLVAGSRAMTGNLNMGTNNITGIGATSHGAAATFTTTDGGTFTFKALTTTILSFTKTLITFAKELAMSGNKITGLGAHNTNGDAVRYEHLAADDHTQYLLVDGSRAMTGALDIDTNNITGVGAISFGTTATLVTPDAGTFTFKALTTTILSFTKTLITFAKPIIANSIVTGDHGTATADEVVNVCYGTSATPPTASTTTEGTLYIQYTA